MSKDRFSRLNIEGNSRRINAGFTFQSSKEDRLIKDEYVYGSRRGSRAKKGAGKKLNKGRYEDLESFGPIGNCVAHVLFTVLTFIYFEFLFHMFIFKTVGEFIGYPILFALPVAFVVLILTSVFGRLANKVIMWVILGIAELVYLAEIIFMYIFKVPLLFTDMGAGNLQVVVYWKEIFITIGKCIPIIIMFAMPLVIYGILLKLGMVMSRKSVMLSFSYGVFGLMFAVISVLAINMSDKEANNIYDNYHDMYDTASAVENYGVFTTLRLNAAKIFGGDSNEIDVDDLVIGTPAPIMTMAPQDNTDGEGDGDEPTVDTSPNMMDIDFVKLAENEDDKTIKKLNQYFASLMPTRKNEYTGMFEGYNLIYLTGEAFSPYAVDKELTPTLYKLTHGGFIFNNYYVPHTGESTCGGEFMNCSGLLTNPNRPRGVYTFYQIKENYMPFSMGNQFKRIGVNPIAYHNNSLSYYDRYITLPNLGYKFKAANAGSIKDSVAEEQGLLFHMDHPGQWPQSDLEMMTYTGGEYISQNQFHAYYMTISGHMLYTFSGNSMANKNKDLVKDLPYSENCKAYIACNIELDRALEELMRQLEEKGVLDKTVICLSSDHYPYGLTNEEISEFLGHDVEENFELYRNNLILYNSAMEPVTIDKPCSSIDIIPTLSNLFGFTYDSRLLPGKDILSDSEGLVIMMNNRSFITDEFMYNASNKKVTDLDGNEIDVSSDKIKEIKDSVNLKIAMNQLLIENDYYNEIKEHLKFD